MNYIYTEFWKGSPNQEYADRALASYAKISARCNK